LGKINTAFDNLKDLNIITELSVVLYTDSFFYGLWSEDETLIKADNHSITNLPKLMKIWHRNYKLNMVRMMSTVKPYVHISTEDYKKKYFDDYFNGLSLNLWKTRDMKKKKDLFIKEKINTLHYLDPETLQQLKEYDFKFKTSHISTALANYAFLVEEELVSYISNGALHVACVKDGRFQFYNQFQCYNAKDFLYYYLLVFQEFGFDPAKKAISVGGEISIDSPLYVLLKAYIDNIKLADRNLKLEQTDLKKHLYYDLYLCKSCV